MVSPASHRNRSPFLNWEEGTIFISSTKYLPTGNIFLAGVSSLVFLKLSACALPLASAMASAKFANSRVRSNTIKMIDYTRGFPVIFLPVKSRYRLQHDGRSYFNCKHYGVVNIMRGFILTKDCFKRFFHQGRFE